MTSDGALCTGTQEPVIGLPAGPKCPYCGRPLREDVKDFIDHVPCEIAYVCEEHGDVGYFAYGHYDPAYEFRG